MFGLVLGSPPNPVLDNLLLHLGHIAVFVKLFISQSLIAKSLQLQVFAAQFFINK